MSRRKKADPQVGFFKQSMITWMQLVPKRQEQQERQVQRQRQVQLEQQVLQEQQVQLQEPT